MPRALALDVLYSVFGRRRPLDDAIADHPRFGKLEPRERAFARNLIATTIRRRGQIDALIETCMDRALPRKAVGVRDILRIGVCQLLFLEVAAHAAVDTAVTLTEERGYDLQKNMVNAILRRLQREGEALIKLQDPSSLNTPEWLWHSWVEAYGIETARRIGAAHLVEAPLDISVQSEPGRWGQELDATPLATGSLRLTPHGPVPAMAGFDEGAWWVQDAAATLPANLLGDIAGKNVIDLCAAPGGKTAQLLSAGAIVTAVDRSKKRLVRVHENLARLNLGDRATTVTADAATWRPDALADAVLLDAPCSATGTMRRHPDVAWLKSPDDVENLSATQARLLDAAIDMVKPGGTLVYCTCSLQPEEGIDQIGPILRTGRVTREAITPNDVGGMAELITPEGDLRTFPFHLSEVGGMDGFFAARLRRV